MSAKDIKLFITGDDGVEHEIGSAVSSDLILTNSDGVKLDFNLQEALQVNITATIEWEFVHVPIEWRFPENDPYLS